MKIFIICSVRDATDAYRQKLECYADNLHMDGHEIHLPHRDTNQNADSWTICSINADAMRHADEVHIFYSSQSQGTHFDLGMAFGLQKKIKVAESEPLTVEKSFPNLLKTWENR